MKQRKKEDAFSERFKRHEDELKWLYCELYNNDVNAWNYFAGMLRKMWEERPASLLALDAEREKNPEWYLGHALCGMQLYTDCFAGDLRGVEENLDYIAECGVNYIHLMPLLESPKDRSDGGYAVSDYRRVKPELGTMEDLERLCESCHRDGIAVCLDFTLNHTSEDHEWARLARAGKKEFQDRYFFFDDKTIPDIYDSIVPQVFPVTAPGNFSWCEEAGKYVMTTFYPYQWDLNYANPTVFNDMTETMLYLCNRGVDVMRLDAVPYIWKSLGTNCRNLPQVHTLVRMLRIVCEIVCPGTLLLGEVVMEPDKVAPYFGTREKPECHMLYNVTTMATIWHSVAVRDARLLSHQLGRVFALPKEYVFLNYIRCHDDIGWGLDYGYLSCFGMQEIPHKKYLNDFFTGKWQGSYSRGELYNDDPRLMDARLCGTAASLCGIESAKKAGDKDLLETAVRRDIMLHALVFTLSGIPVLYSGDEIGQENDYSYTADPEKAPDSRYIHRGLFDREKAALRLADGTVENRLFSAVRALTDRRKGMGVFDNRADTWVIDTQNPAVFGMGRYYEGEKLLAFFNFGDCAETFSPCEKETYENLFTGEKTDADSLELPAGGFVWLYKKY